MKRKYMNKFADDDNSLNKKKNMVKRIAKEKLIKNWLGATVLLESGYIFGCYIPQKLSCILKTALHTQSFRAN